LEKQEEKRHKSQQQQKEHKMRTVLILLLAALASYAAHSFKLQHQQQLLTHAQLWKKTVAASIGLSLLIPAFPALADDSNLKPSAWNPKILVETLKKPTGDVAVKVGENVGIRFRASYKGQTIDDTFKTEQPYLFRAGVGLVVPGLDETVVQMKLGERLHVQFPGELGFGDKGIKSSPGKPRIPPNAELDYEVELVEMPGTLEEFIAGDDI